MPSSSKTYVRYTKTFFFLDVVADGGLKSSVGFRWAGRVLVSDIGIGNGEVFRFVGVGVRSWVGKRPDGMGGGYETSKSTLMSDERRGSKDARGERRHRSRQLTSR
jgi:hypothetical protein